MQSARTDRSRSRTPPLRQQWAARDRRALSGNIFMQLRHRRATGHATDRCGGVAGVYALIDAWLSRQRKFNGSVLTCLHGAPLVDRYAVVMGGPVTGRRHDEILTRRLARAGAFRTNPHTLPAHARREHEAFTAAFFQYLSHRPEAHRREQYRARWFAAMRTRQPATRSRSAP